MSGVIPAIPLIVIRPFLPESPAWAEKKRAGTLRRPSFAALFTPEFRRTTIVTTMMMAAVYATAFGAIQQMPRVVPGLEAGPHAGRVRRRNRRSAASRRFQEIGGLAGRVALAYLAAIIISRRRLLHVFQFPGIVLLPLVFLLVPIRRTAARAMGNLPRRLHDHRPNEFLGELSPARLPDAPARHGRELRGQRRRAHDRHVCARS